VGLMFIILGLCNVVVAAAGYLSPRVYHVEDDLPDAVQESTAIEPVTPAPEVVSSAPGLSGE